MDYADVDYVMDMDSIFKGFDSEVEKVSSSLSTGLSTGSASAVISEEMPCVSKRIISEINLGTSTCGEESLDSTSEDSKVTVSSPVALKRRQIVRGGTCPLPQFLTLKGTAPKHEYFVAMLIRSFRKAARNAVRCGKHCPQGGLFNVIRRNKVALLKWTEFVEQVDHLSLYLEQIIRNDASLNPDERNRENGGESLFKSFNKQYVHNFFDPPYVRIAFYYFSEFLFSVSPAELCSALKYKCCSEDHTPDCLGLWSWLKDYTQDSMIKEIDLEPFLPRSA